MTNAQKFSAAVETFRVAFEVGFNAARAANRGSNLVSLAAIRAALPQYDAPAFQAGLYQLRLAGMFVLEQADGRHGKPSAELVAAGIVEGGRRFLYVSRRES